MRAGEGQCGLYLHGAALTEAKARDTADTADDAYRLMMAAQDATQAMLSAYLGFRERVAAA